MACFIVPATEAVITTAVTKIVAAKENKETTGQTQLQENESGHGKNCFSRKLSWLNKMLWGGSALLAFEHVWHGEVIPYAPFLTAVKTGETADMLSEMSTAGVMMAVLVTLVWGGMVAASALIERRGTAEEAEKAE